MCWTVDTHSFLEAETIEDVTDTYTHTHTMHANMKNVSFSTHGTELRDDSSNKRFETVNANDIVSTEPYGNWR